MRPEGAVAEPSLCIIRTRLGREAECQFQPQMSESPPVLSTEASGSILDTPAVPTPCPAEAADSAKRMLFMPLSWRCSEHCSI